MPIKLNSEPEQKFVKVVAGAGVQTNSCGSATLPSKILLDIDGIDVDFLVSGGGSNHDVDISFHNFSYFFAFNRSVNKFFVEVLDSRHVPICSVTNSFIPADFLQPW